MVYVVFIEEEDPSYPRVNACFSSLEKAMEAIEKYKRWDIEDGVDEQPRPHYYVVSYTLDGED